MKNMRFAVSVGDATKVVQPGAEIEYVFYAQKTFQLRELRGTQFVDDGGRAARWPVVACYVGAEYVDGAQALYDGLGLTTVKCGQQVRLRLKNPLGVPAVWVGSFVGVAVDHRVPTVTRYRSSDAVLPTTAAEIECLVSDHVWEDCAPLGGRGRTCLRCNKHEDVNAVGTYGPDQTLVPRREASSPYSLIGGSSYAIPPTVTEPLRPQPLTAAQLEQMVRDANGPRCSCGRRTDALCPCCGAPRCDEHRDVAGVCRMTSGGSVRACVERAARLAKRCAICNDTEPTPSRGSVGWIYGGGGVAYCRACVEARGGAEAFCIYQATHDGAVPPRNDHYSVPPATRDCELPRTADELARALPGIKPEHVSAIIAPPRHVVQRFVYCEAAPPRAVVEGTTTVLDGDECGGVPRARFLTTHLKFTARQLLAADRHDVFARRACAQRGLPWFDAVARPDHDVDAPRDVDLYGGRVVTSATASLTSKRRELVGYRCALCGAWLREVLR